MPSDLIRRPVRRQRERRKITGQQALASVHPVAVTTLVSAVADPNTWTLHCTLSSPVECINLLAIASNPAGTWFVASFPSGVSSTPDVQFSAGQIYAGYPVYLIGFISGGSISSPVVVIT